MGIFTLPMVASAPTPNSCWAGAGWIVGKICPTGPGAGVAPVGTLCRKEHHVNPSRAYQVRMPLLILAIDSIQSIGEYIAPMQSLDAMYRAA
jgi:hypothetical protein